MPNISKLFRNKYIKPNWTEQFLPRNLNQAYLMLYILNQCKIYKKKHIFRDINQIKKITIWKEKTTLPSTNQITMK